MNNFIFVFPGQGAQYVGMGKDMFANFGAVRYVFEEISDVSNKNIAKICFDGPQDLLNEPENTSLATFAYSAAISRVIEACCGRPLYSIAYAVAGHSMGQYSALYCAGSLDLKDSVNLLKDRTAYMSQAGADGGMISIVGLNKSQIEEILHANAHSGYAEISNYNSKEQFVISGQNSALEKILENAKKMGAKIAVRLNVMIAAHCRLMIASESLLRMRLSEIKLTTPKTNWFSNHTGTLVHRADEIKESLALQMTHGVRWVDIMEKFPEHNIGNAYELGPGRVLSGLINRAGVSCSTYPSNNIGNINRMLNSFQRT